MDYTVHGILQARILEWVAFPFSRGSSQPRDQTQVSLMQVDSLPAEPHGKPKNTEVGSLSLLQWIFPTHESNRGLLYCRQILYQLSYQGSPTVDWRVAKGKRRKAGGFLPPPFFMCVKFGISKFPARQPLSSIQFSRSVVSNSLRPHESQHARPPCPSPTPEFTQTHVHWVGDAIQQSHLLSSLSLPAPNPSQHQGLFQWVNSSHEVAKVLEFQL